jgi:dTDP-4-dehydrorhamnose 3,5-epimerase
MRFVTTALAGAYLIETEPQRDERGLFARTFCGREFQQHQLAAAFVQCNTSFSRRRGTLRGLHYQLPPAGEIKLVRCTAGAIWDVIVDLRTGSPTWGKHIAVELTAQNRRALYIPEWFAHGFQTLTDDAEVHYQMSEFYTPDQATGVRFDDPKLGIRWPLPVSVISDKDKNWPSL